MRSQSIHDPDGDMVLAQEQADRALERADSPLTYLDIRPSVRWMEGRVSLRCVLATIALGLLFYALAFGSLFAVGAFGSCHSHACWKRVHAHRAQHWCLAHARCVWKHRWRAEESSWQNWLRSTAQCESGNRAHIATGNGYFGLVQFDLSTWHEAGGYGYPHHATWYEQAVRAIELAKRVGTGRWPVCGR